MKTNAPSITSSFATSSFVARATLAAIAAAGAALVLGACATPVVSEERAATTDAITNVRPTSVKKQVVGNCWLYSITGWAESLHASVSGEELNLSESYLTYWGWFEQLVAPPACGISAIQEGGSWELGRDLILRRGMMREADFIPEEGTSLTSQRQAEALEALQAALSTKSSVMQRAVDAGDRSAIRAELDRMWKLSPQVRADLDAVFGDDASRTLEASTATVPAKSKVIAANKLSAKIPDGTTRRALFVGSLADALSGPLEWSSASSPIWSSDSDDYAVARRAYERRIQRALHDGLPVLMSWWVDGRSLDDQGSFKAWSGVPSAHGGGHMSIITDYEVTDVPRFGTLKAGKVETRPEALNAALDERAKITFFRIKNSWGYWQRTSPKAVLARIFGGIELGYNDLHQSYLFDPMTVLIDSSALANTSPCAAAASPPAESTTVPVGLVPLWDVILPPGY